MTTYRIESKAGADHGTYEGETAAAALAAMHQDAGYEGVSADGDTLRFPDEETAELCGGLEDWVMEPVEPGEVGESEIRELCILTTRDQTGRHFIEYSEHWQALEDAGLIVVHRPVHHQTGMPYGQEHWSLEVTETGQEVVDANEELHPEVG